MATLFDSNSERVARYSDGFTLVELMLGVALIGLLAGLSITSYLDYIEKARVVRAVAEIAGISKILEGISAGDDATLPTSLAEIEQDTVRDPWGNPYQYLRIAGDPPPGMAGIPSSLPPVGAGPGSRGASKGAGAGAPAAAGGGGPPAGTGGGGPPAIALARKDRFLVPINSDYDLYSMGKDGKTQAPLMAEDSRDDVIRAADGAYIGLAERF